MQAALETEQSGGRENATCTVFTYLYNNIDICGFTVSSNTPLFSNFKVEFVYYHLYRPNLRKCFA